MLKFSFRSSVTGVMVVEVSKQLSMKATSRLWISFLCFPEEGDGFANIYKM